MSSRGRIANLARYIFVDGRMGRLRFFSIFSICLAVPYLFFPFTFVIGLFILFPAYDEGGQLDFAFPSSNHPLASALIDDLADGVLLISLIIIVLAGISRIRSMGLGKSTIINLFYVATAILFWIDLTVSFGFWHFAIEWEKILQQFIVSLIGDFVIVVVCLWLLCLLFLPVGVFHKLKLS